MIVLTLAVVCGVYICSICLKQFSTRTKVEYVNVQVVERPCEASNIEPWEKPYLHYPKPKTFSRWDFLILLLQISVKYSVTDMFFWCIIRAECGCNPVRFFAILSTQRSGSGWFETLLNSHINVSSNGEIFSVKVRRSNFSTIVETLDNIYNLDMFTSASKNECTAAVGLKWMLNQASAVLIWKLIFLRFRYLDLRSWTYPEVDSLESQSNWKSESVYSKGTGLLSGDPT